MKKEMKNRMSHVIEKLEEQKLLLSIGDIDLKKNYGTFLKIGIVSETIGFLINRNNEATELTSENFQGSERLVVPAQKWRGPERSYLLSELRKAGGIIPEEYSRNMVVKKILLKNPSSLIFGDSSTGSGSEAAGMASRMFYDWSYSYEPLARISVRYLHNTLSEEGTILHEENGTTKSNAIYNVPYVRPGVKLIRYVSMENSSREMLLLALMAISGTTRYGARTAILGDNIRNNIVSIGFSKQETPVSSYSTLMKAWSSDSYDPEKLVTEEMHNAYGEVLVGGEDLRTLMTEVNQLRRSPDQLRAMGLVLVNKMEDDWSVFWNKKSSGKTPTN